MQRNLAPLQLCASCCRRLLGRPPTSSSRPFSTTRARQAAAGPSPSLTRLNRTGAGTGSGSKPARTTTSSRAFAGLQIPAAPFWTGHEPLTGATGIPAAALLRAATVYRDQASQAAPGWQARLETQHQVPRRTLYYAACILFFRGRGFAAAPAAAAPATADGVGLGHLAFHMLGTLLELGYAPATLTLRRLAMDSARSQPRGKVTSFEQRVLDAFRELVRKGDSADALTLQGELCLAHGQADKALAYFARAAAVGTEASQKGETTTESGSSPAAHDDVSGRRRRRTSHQREEERDMEPDRPDSAAPPDAQAGRETGRQPRWAWEVACLLGTGSILQKQGKQPAALAAYQTAALDLNNAAGFVGMARLLPATDPRREPYLVKAAVSGDAEACRQLAGLAQDRLARAAQASRSSSWETRLGSVMSKEWSTLAT
jgi:hypothetical protein